VNVSCTESTLVHKVRYKKDNKPSSEVSYRSAVSVNS